MKQMLILMAAIVLFASCKKENIKEKYEEEYPNSLPSDIKPYFKFTFDGKTYELNSRYPLFVGTIASMEHHFGGIQAFSNEQKYPTIGVQTFRRDYSSLTDNEMLALKGKTLYFDDLVYQPQITYSIVNFIYDTDPWISQVSSDKKYNIHITDVKFIKKGTSDLGAIRIYLVTGTCRALMKKKSGETKELTDGAFSMAIATWNSIP